MNRWVDFYRDVMGFRCSSTSTIRTFRTEYSALMSKVMSNGNDRVKFPINEPAQGRSANRRSRSTWSFISGPGVQHIAMGTDEHHRHGGRLRSAGRGFSARAYDLLRRPAITRRHDRRAAGRTGALGILVDRDDEGYMLQIFTKPVEDRPTLFYEVIQRKGSRSFGKGNFKALFEAIEREQAARGNL